MLVADLGKGNLLAEIGDIFTIRGVEAASEVGFKEGINAVYNASFAACDEQLFSEGLDDKALKSEGVGVEHVFARTVCVANAYLMLGFTFAVGDGR